MTPTNIIELVKKLKEEHESYRDEAWDMCGMNVIHKHFPAIAEALLIAVEALEKAEHEDHCISLVPDSSDYYWKKCNCNLERQQEALSRIQSLLPS